MIHRFITRRPVLSAAAACCLALSGMSAQASVIITYTQIGNQVKGVWEGNLDTSAFPSPIMRPSNVAFTSVSDSGVRFGPISADFFEYRFPTFFTPFATNFTFGTFDGGDAVQLERLSSSQTILRLPYNYQSGAALSSAATWNNHSFVSLGINTTDIVMNIPGDQTISLRFVDANAAPVPEPAGMALVALALAGLGLTRRSVMVTPV